MVKYEGKKRTNKVKDGTLGSLVDENTSKVKEYIDTGLRYPTQLLYFPRDILKNKYHPTQKPVALCEYLISTFTNEDDMILDPFMGGGSIGVAAKGLYRNFIGIEKEQKYFDIARKRIN